MADEVAVPFELRKARGVLQRAVSRDLASARLAASDAPTSAPARLALHFSLITTGHSGDEAIARVYGPLGVDGWMQFRDDYDSIMPRVQSHIRDFAKQCVAGEKNRLSRLLFRLNAEGMPERLSAAAQRIGREAGGLSLAIDWDRAQLERAYAREKNPRATTPPPVPHVGPEPSLEALKKSREDAAELKRFYSRVKDLARARIGPFVRKDPLLATLFEHPENESLDVPLGGLSILQAYASSAVAEGGASRANSAIPALPPQVKAPARSPAAQTPAAGSRRDPMLESYLPAVSYTSNAGTSLATSVIQHAMGALAEFSSELGRKGNEDHALRYLPFVLGGIEKSGLSNVAGFRDFAVADCENIARSAETLLDAAGLTVAYVGLLFPTPAGAAVGGVASFAIEAARVPFVYLREHEQELASTAGVFLGQARQWAQPTDYSETAFAALSAAATLVTASVFYLEHAADFLKLVRSAVRRVPAERAAAELAALEARDAAIAARQRLTTRPATGTSSSQSTTASALTPSATSGTAPPQAWEWSATSGPGESTWSASLPSEPASASPKKDVRLIKSQEFESTFAKKVGDPTRGSVKLEPKEAAAYAAGKPSGYVWSRKLLGSVFKGRLIGTGDRLSVQAGHMVAKSTGKPGGLAIELTSLNQAYERKLIPKEAIVIDQAVIERESAKELLNSGRFPKLTQKMIDEAPTHGGWVHPTGMSEARAQSTFMNDQLSILSDPEHPLHQLTESYEEITAGIPDRPMIIPP